MSIRPNVNHAADAISKVHKRPPKIPKARVRTINYEGPDRGAYDRGLHDIHIQPVALGNENPEMVFIHEYGHSIDHIQFGDGLSADRIEAFTNASELPRAPRFDVWWSAVSDTDAYKTLARLLEEAPVGGRRFLDYVLSPREIFARSYAQWIAIRSKDDLLSSQLRAMIGGDKPLQWRAADFRAIARVLDEIFEGENLKP